MEWKLKKLLNDIKSAVSTDMEGIYSDQYSIECEVNKLISTYKTKGVDNECN